MPAIRREHIFLSIAFVVLTISTAVWTHENRIPPSWDPADHMRTAFDFYQPLSDGHFAAFFREVFHAHHAYGPLFHWIAAAAFLLGGFSSLTGIAANFLALAVLLLSVNWIGDRLFSGSPDLRDSSLLLRPGAIAALLAASYHFPGWLLHEAFLDYLLTAIVALTFALLIRAGEFHVRRDAIAFGTAAGLGLLAKQTFLFFFILPGMFLGARALMRRDGKAIVNLAIAASVAVLIASVWYVPHLGDSIGIYKVNVMNAAVEHEAPAFSFRSVAYYWGALVGLQIQLLFGILFVAGAAYSVLRRSKKDWMIYLWILSGILSFTLIANKDPRYTVPILPAVALLSVSWLGHVRWSRRGLATIAITVWAFLSFFNAQWPELLRMDFRSSVRGLPLYFFAGNVFRFDHRPMAEDWRIPEIVGSASGKLGVVPNIWQLNPSNIALYARVHAPQLRILWLSDAGTRTRLEECDYVLARRTHLDSAERAEAVEERVASYLQVNADRYVPVATFSLPDNQEAVLYKRLRVEENGQ